ncbi:dynamin GTPase [Coccidioides posadasii str. Silveira]|uniref:Dynamin GTPase n=1 Tax=Coccidioides posadasii (strain RMSCC 757 / Silveira) TaxID=443226 RepID=E9D488_COCPS|nr:dynamin GTPase [Coccidioides posadasii str. Silveira]
MALQSFDSDALGQLQSEQSQLLDAIDELRSLHLGHLVELPQLIVCGDQSSGKSSVLEAISRVRFPAKGGVCTRFATEVILRRKPDSGIKVTIEPGPSRMDEEEKRRLRNFPTTLAPDTPLSTLIESAKECMGISSTDERTAGFSDDVLKVEISGPDKPGLTLVDLPGLYHAKSKEQGAQGIPIVRNLVKSYMSNQRSLILAVISAKNEYNNQEVLDLAEKYDKKRERTLAIVTKPDTLPKGSEEEQMYIDLVNNERIKLQLGWHALRNRDYDTRDISDGGRDEMEREFFSDGQWTNVPRGYVGIDTLRPKLSTILLDHISRSLPSLIKDIESKICDRQAKLDQLGEERATAGQKRSYLLNVSSRFEKITSQAVNGIDSATITVADLEKEVSEMARKNRGIELPGTSNQVLVGELFRDQSKPWEGIAETYLTKVWRAIKDFTELLLLHLTEKATYRTLMSGILNPALETMKERALQKLQELVFHHKNGHPLPFDGEFLKSMDVRRQERRLALLERKLLETSASAANDKSKAIFSFRDIQKAVSDLEEDSGNQFAAREIIDLMEVYYNMARTTFIDNVAILVTENCLITPLQTIFTALTVSNMDDQEIRRLAAEPIYVQRNREQFRSELSRLNAALKVCKHHITGTEALFDTRVNGAPNLLQVVSERREGPTHSSSTADLSKDSTARIQNKEKNSAGLVSQKPIRTPSIFDTPPSAAPSDVKTATNAVFQTNSSAPAPSTKKFDISGTCMESSGATKTAALATSKSTSLFSNSSMFSFPRDVANLGNDSPGTKEDPSGFPPRHSGGFQYSGKPFGDVKTVSGSGFGSTPETGGFSFGNPVVSAAAPKPHSGFGRPREETPSTKGLGNGPYFEERPTLYNGICTDYFYSITSLLTNNSFEELRLADYALEGLSPS